MAVNHEPRLAPEFDDEPPRPTSVAAEALPAPDVEMEGTNAATASSLESGLSHILQAQLQLQEQVLE
jgi:hypothetical protein